jgi:protein arginine N-methyltransferase 3
MEDLPTSPAGKAAKIKSGQTYFAGKLHEHRTYATAFILWCVSIFIPFFSYSHHYHQQWWHRSRFETFFHPGGKQYGPNNECKVHTGEGEWETGDVLKLRPSVKRKKTGELDATKTSVEEKTKDDTSAAPTETAKLPTTTTATSIDAEKGREESFTTGPHGTQTHWKQTVFLLKSPVELNRGRYLTCPS